ncbi:MAG: rhodanese [Gammaproteobacteria bacterium]|nr:rhodanese [Gammaproteobacteria bacterium]HAN80418.1 rhodanese [Gammaproteobacteria bacterium]|tara:strand:- start:122 stop:499 length:378 start_codon:yes stop_codon:yes gene_type:complete
MKKTAQDFLSEANALVPTIGVADAVSLMDSGNAVVIDVRDGKEIDQSGTVKDALRIPRGMIEFVADPSTDFYNDQISIDKEILVICGAGGMAALTGKTLVDMGYDKVHNLGGFSAWKDAGGPTES